MMSECASDSGNIATCGIPFNVRDAVVLRLSHQLQVGMQVLFRIQPLLFRLLEVQVPELEVEALLIL